MASGPARTGAATQHQPFNSALGILMSKKRKHNPLPNVVAADPEQWSEKSKQSYSFHYIKEYKDISYNCWHCRKEAIFTADDQKYTYEVHKARIDQQRSLCHECWMESLKIAKSIEEREKKWLESKETLKKDNEFLSEWLELLENREKYVAYKPNTAAKNMLKKCISKNA